MILKADIQTTVQECDATKLHTYTAPWPIKFLILFFNIFIRIKSTTKPI